MNSVALINDKPNELAVSTDQFASVRIGIFVFEVF